MEEKKFGRPCRAPFCFWNTGACHQHDTYIITGTKILTYEDVQEEQGALGWASDEEEAS
jgi:hypothetical protein